MRYIAGLIFFLSLVLMATFVLNGYLFEAHQHSLEEINALEQKKAEDQDEIRDLRMQVVEERKNTEGVIAEKNQKITEIQQRDRTITEQKNQINGLQNQISNNQADMENLIKQFQQTQANLDSKQADLNKVVEAYQKLRAEDQITLAQLEQSKKENEQLVNNNADQAEQIKTYQTLFTLASDLQQNAVVPAAVLGGSTLIGFVFFGIKKIKAADLRNTPTWLTGSNGQARKQVKIVMTEQTYKAFQEYIKNK
jgi:hypothetical protein